MKKIIALLIILLSLNSLSFAQTEVKVKPTSTPAQRVHNTFSKHKRHNGVKVKTRHHKVKAVAKKEEVEVKAN